MTKYFVDLWGCIKFGEESVLSRLHHDTPLADTAEEAVKLRRIFIRNRIEQWRQAYAKIDRPIESILRTEVTGKLQEGHATAPESR